MIPVPDEHLGQMVAVWQTAKAFGVPLLAMVGAFSSLTVYYLRSMASSMKHIGEMLARHEVRIDTHEDRIERIEDKIF